MADCNSMDRTSESTHGFLPDDIALSDEELAIYRLLESRWDELSCNVARRVTTTVIWHRRIQKATWCVAAMIAWTTVQMGLDFACLLKLEAARGKLAAAIRMSLDETRSNRPST